MNIRFYNARILTMQTPHAQPIQGELWCENGVITAVGTPAHPAPEWDREIDADGNVLLPGFKNAHTHSAMTFLRSYADDMPLLEWLNKQVFPMEAKLCAAHIAPLATLAIMEYLQSGITACFDMYMFPEEMAQTSIATGFRTVLCGCYSDFINTIEMLEKQHLRFNALHPLITHRLGFHAEYTTGAERLRDLSALCHQYQAPISTHNSESLAEVQDCIRRTGKTPTAYLNDFGLFDFGGACFHCVHVSEEDIEIFKQKGLDVVTNPASNMKLASGIAPLCDFHRAGVPLAMGTDGPASNNCLDFFREMFLATGMQKLRYNDAAAMDAREVLYMATVGGAHAMGLADCDTLDVGKRADIVMLDMHAPNMQPMNNITKNIVYSASKQNVKLTMVDGKILYENGAFFIGVQPEDIYAKANAIIGEFVK